MKKFKYWAVAAVIGLLMGAAFWWSVKEKNNPLNQADAFVYSDNGILHWFELTSKSGKIKGKLHQQRFIGKPGEAQFVEEKIYPLSGDTTDKGYNFMVNVGGGKILFKAWFSGPHLSVQKQGEKENKFYNPVNKQELEEYVNALKDYHKEEDEKQRLRTFFSELRSVYGYLYKDENDSFLLFVKIDEALLQGELTGSLLMLDDKGKETRYAFDGITDGNIVRLFTTLDGKETKLEGNFQDGAAEFHLSFWPTGQILTFRAVTEEEFKQTYEEFKK